MAAFDTSYQATFVNRTHLDTHRQTDRQAETEREREREREAP